MKKGIFHKSFAFVLAAFLVAGIYSPLSIQTHAATTALVANQIGSFDQNGKLQFYATFAANARATPYSIGPPLAGAVGNIYATTGSDIDYRALYSSNSPAFYINKNTLPNSMDETAIKGTTLSVNTLANSFALKEQTQKSRAYLYSADAEIDVAAKFNIVMGLNGKEDVLRYEYTVTNKKTYDLYIAGRMHADTTLGALSGAYTDRALSVIDSSEQYTYNAATNPNGFLEEGGQINTLVRFVEGGSTDPNYIRGMPLSWRNVMQFNAQNPLTSYFRVMPDFYDTVDHFYPTPNVVDFRRYQGSTSYSGTTPAWLPLAEQTSGQLTSDDGDKNTRVPYGSGVLTSEADSQTSIQWNPTKIAAGQSVSYVYFIGMDKTTMTSEGSLTSLLAASPSTTFPILNNVIQPLNISLQLKNSNVTTNITDTKVKFVYDENKIRMLDDLGAHLAKTGDISTTLNGVLGTYAYFEFLPGDINATQFKNLTFQIKGINTTVSQLNTYTKAIIEFKDPAVKTLESNQLYLTIPGLLEEDKTPGYLHVIHKVQGIGAILHQYDLAGIVGNLTTSYPLDFVNYELAPAQPLSQTGTLIWHGEPEFNTHVYEYVAKANTYNLGDVLIEHIGLDEDGANQILLALEHSHGPIGGSFTAQSKSWPGYLGAETASATPGGVATPTQTTTFQNAPPVIKFYYAYNTANSQGYLDVYNNIGRVYVEHRDEATNALIAKDTIIANIDLASPSATINVNAIDINSYMLADTLSKQVTVMSGGSQTVVFKYRQVGYIKVSHINKQTLAPIFEEYIVGAVGATATAKSKDFTSYRLDASQNNNDSSQVFTATIPGPVPEVIFRYNPNPGVAAGDILIKHVDRDNPMNVLAVEHIHGMVGVQTTVSPKTMVGYNPSSDSPQLVTFADTPTEIVFLYDYNTSNPFNVSTINLYSGIVYVEHRDKDTNVLIARDTILDDIPLGQQSQPITVRASDFKRYQISGDSTKVVDVGINQTSTATFLYSFLDEGAETHDYDVIFVNRDDNEEFPASEKYKGISGQVIDFSKITGVPAGFILAESNDYLRVPDAGTAIYLIIIDETVPEIEKTELYLSFYDIRDDLDDTTIKDLTYYKLDPGSEVTEPPEKPEHQQEQGDEPDLAIPPLGYSDGDAELPQGEEEPAQSAALVLGFSGQLEDSDLPQADADPVEGVLRTAELGSNFIYNVKSNYTVGSIYDITTDPIISSEIAAENGYRLYAPLNGRVVYFGRDIRQNPVDTTKTYILQNAVMTPKKVKLIMSLVDENGAGIDVQEKTVDWGTVVNKAYMTSYLAAEYPDYEIYNVEDRNNVGGDIYLNATGGHYNGNGDYPVKVTMIPPGMNGLPPLVPPVDPPVNPPVKPPVIKPSGPDSDGGGISYPGWNDPRPPSETTPKDNLKQQAGVSQATLEPPKNPGVINNLPVETSRVETQLNSQPSAGVSGESEGEEQTSEAETTSQPQQQQEVSAASPQPPAIPAVAQTNNAQVAVASVGALVVLGGLFLLFALSSRIIIVYRDGEGKEKDLRVVRYFENLRASEGPRLDISNKNWRENFESGSIEVIFGKIYTKAVAAKSLKFILNDLEMSVKVPDDFGKNSMNSIALRTKSFVKK